MMKRYVFAVLLLLFAFVKLFAQSTSFYGTLSNYKNGYELRISLSNSVIEIDSLIPVSPSGAFTMVLSDLVHEPSFVSLTLRDTASKLLMNQPLLFAPSYNLSLRAIINEADFKDTERSINISGKGAHLSQLYLNKSTNGDTVNWIAKDIKTYVNYLNNIAWSEENRRLDSLISTVPDNPFSDEWKEVFALQQIYINLSSLVANYGFNNDTPVDTIQRYFKEIGFANFWSQLNQEANLKSSSYRYFIGQLSFFVKEGLIKYPQAVNEQSKDKQFPQLYMLDQLFTGKIRDYVLENDIRKLILNTHDLEKMDSLKGYISWVMDPLKRKKLIQVASNRTEIISSLRPGSHIAKKIQLKNSNTQAIIELSELKGKLVFIESWASWCGPCKQEVPHLKKLVEHYKDNPHISFVSLGVFDDKEDQIKNRIKFIKDNQMNWLQLEDVSRNFSDYFKVKAIPHNVILDKEGRIVDNDSLRPSDPNIVKYLDKLLKERL